MNVLEILKKDGKTIMYISKETEKALLENLGHYEKSSLGIKTEDEKNGVIGRFIGIKIKEL